MIEVRIEVFALRNIHTERRSEVITSRNVINVVNTTGSKFNLREISRPDTTVSILSLILREVRRIDVIANNSISLIPFLIVILFKMLMGRVNSEIANHLS